jgi:uncharacterized protein YjbJ (UPF0337 family)
MHQHQLPAAQVRQSLLEIHMNRDTMAGDWKVLKGKIKSKWGKLTDDELDQIEGNREMLSGRIQKTYGLTREEVDRELDSLN